MIIPAILIILLSIAHVSLCDNNFKARDVCNNDYTLCNPKGASTSNEPPISSALSPLFIDIINTVDNNKETKRVIAHGTDRLKPRLLGGGLCCTDGTQCLLLQDLNLPFCYDNYTTNYYLPGGSYGQIVSGSYTASDGSTANLISGNYTLTDGTTGNIYGSPSSPSKPNTATLDIPTQYTASGSISAIPVAALGQDITYTTVISGTTIPPSIVSAITTIPTIADDRATTLVSTEVASTIPGTTIGPRTSTVTTRVAAASATAKGVAYVLEPGATAMTFAVISGYILRRVFM